jgi:thioredoxin reductase
VYDALIIGGGAAGASCALWLTRLGLAPLLVDQSDRLGGLLNDSPFRNEWLVTQPAVTGPDLAAGIESSLKAAGTAVLRGRRVTRVARASCGFDISLSECAPITARYVVLASGVQPVRGGLVASERILIGPGAHIARQDFAGKRVAILGGGDNAFENHASVLGKGAERADLFARTVRAARWARRLVDPAAVHAGAYEVDAGQAR